MFRIFKRQTEWRGVSGKQAFDLYSKLSESQAAKTGILSELAECDLFVEGIGPDKISDITTNILRKLCIEYTQKQCDLMGIKLARKVASGKLWDLEKREWTQDYVALPIINERKIILVPKSAVRFQLSLDAGEYYNHFILNFLQTEHLNAHSSLVHILRNGTHKVYKKDLKELHPFNKEWMAEFSKQHPEVIEEYKQHARKSQKPIGFDVEEINKSFDEQSFAKSLSQSLKNVPPGNESASKYHSLMIGILEFLFWPNLIYPEKEDEIHDGRKRIDFTFTNNSKEGFFYRARTSPQMKSLKTMIECKNYTKDPKNPEIDQLSGRFSNNRGFFGILLYRTVSDYGHLIKSCKDTAGDGRGFIIPLGDDQILEYLDDISDGNRKNIDRKLSAILDQILS